MEQYNSKLKTQNYYSMHTNPILRYVLPAAPAQAMRHYAPVLVVGGGAAGLTAALAAAAYTDVALLVRTTLPQSNSAWAQGGIAAALDESDSPRFHIDDTLIAGAGLCDMAAVEALAYEAPALMRELAAQGVPFERDSEDHFALGLEGGHSQRRIVHVGDATGWAVTRLLIAQVQAHPRIRVCEGYQAVELLGNRRVKGVLALDDHGLWHRFEAGATILATGGAGALYGLTSNQPIALGEGIAMAYRAGAEVADMEFVQFHPTVMRTRNGQGFLISEAARGEGGKLYTVDGERFMPAYDPRAELAPRDVVTRGIYAAMARSQSDHVLLDLTHLSREQLQHHFPTIYARCIQEGIDPAVAPIPVAPASHYLMGGIRTDLDGATSLPGLYAAGECACTGVHGANRLASNSLLECLVFGKRAGLAAGQQAGSRKQEAAPSDASFLPPPASFTTATLATTSYGWRETLATLMRAHAGPLRDGASLQEGLARLASFPMVAEQPDSEAITAANAALVAHLIMRSALLREESRGGHFRSDFPQSDLNWRKHTVLQRGAEPSFIETIAAPVAMAQAAD
jgi:L-aspartate oxidase